MWRRSAQEQTAGLVAEGQDVEASGKVADGEGGGAFDARRRHKDSREGEDAEIAAAVEPQGV